MIRSLVLIASICSGVALYFSNGPMDCTPTSRTHRRLLTTKCTITNCRCTCHTDCLPSYGFSAPSRKGGKSGGTVTIYQVTWCGLKLLNILLSPFSLIYLGPVFLILIVDDIHVDRYHSQRLFRIVGMYVFKLVKHVNVATHIGHTVNLVISHGLNSSSIIDPALSDHHCAFSSFRHSLPSITEYTIKKCYITPDNSHITNSNLK